MAVKKPEKQKKAKDLDVSKTKGGEAVKGGRDFSIKIGAIKDMPTITTRTTLIGR
jgi:hypothetical protein